MRRRSFLAFMGAAPVAAPVALREAAISAGIKPVGLGSIGPGGVYGGGVVTAGSAIASDAVPWLVRHLIELDAPDTIERYFAKTDPPSRLDPDLASSRSLSLSVAMLQQRRRDAERDLALSRQQSLREFRDQYGCDWSGAAAWLARPLTRKNG